MFSKADFRDFQELRNNGRLERFGTTNVNLCFYRSRSDERGSNSHESMKKSSENSVRHSKSQHYLQSQSRKRAREVNKKLIYFDHQITYYI